MRLRELKFPILIRHPNELEGGKGALLHRPSARFDWAFAVAFEDGRFDDAEILDSNGQTYRVVSIFFMRPTIWRKFMNRLGHLLILPSFERRQIVRVDMELEPSRKLNFEQFKVEFRGLILTHPAWWKRYASRTEMEAIFSNAKSFPEAFDEIGFLSPSENLVYKGKSHKIVDLR